VWPKAEGNPEPVTLNALADARAKWKAAGIQSYDYWPVCEYFVAPVRVKNFRIIVRRGKVVNADAFGSGSLVLVSDAALTIDETFDELQREVEQNLATGQRWNYEALFDPTLGYPVSIGSGPAPGKETMTDLGASCTVKEFRIRRP
jgi:hypothetical protein